MNMIKYPDIDIKEKSITFIDGESGCGKSTLLKLFNGTQSPSKGIIEYKGINIDDMSLIELRKEVILASQDIFLFDGSIKDNFKEFYDFREEKCIDDKEMKKYLEISCADFPLEAKCQTLSGGERQRVFLAIYLSFKSKVILLDEPTASLDEKTSVRFFEQTIRHCKDNNITMISVCHNPKLVQMFGEDIITLRKEG
jgi:putative ABC transport system ATP-binding protein